MIKIPKHIEDLNEYTSILQESWKNKNKNSILKLDWNEATDDIYFSVLREKIIDLFRENKLNWYPPIMDECLLKLLSNYTRINVKNIKYFPGSDKALEYITRTFCSKGDLVTIISPTYDNFRIYPASVGCILEFVYPKNIFAEDILIQKYINVKSKIVYLVNPNNPSGWLYSKDTICRLLNKFKDTLFIIDEAYIEFCPTNTVSSLINECNNLIISRTFSKAWGLASIRFGYLLAEENLLKVVNKIVNKKEVPYFTLEIAKFALKHQEIMESYVEEVKKSKKFVEEKFGKLRIFDFIKISPGNFIIVKIKQKIREKLHKHFLKHKVYIRNFDYLSGFSGYDRITIGGIKKTLKLYNILKGFKL